MLILFSAHGIAGGLWCPCHQTGPHRSPSHSFLYEIGVRHRYGRRTPTDRQNLAITTAPVSHLTKRFGRDASHRAKDEGIHLTHDRKRLALGFSRMRSGCADRRPREVNVIPGLSADTRRVQGGGE